MLPKQTAGQSVKLSIGHSRIAQGAGESFKVKPIDNLTLKLNHLADRVESCHLTNFDAFRVNRDLVMDFETWLQAS